MRRSSLILGTLALTGLGVAWASSQTSKSFVSDRACQDGGLGCMVEGAVLSATPVKDEAGRLMPSDMRIGFFDLKATPAFSVHGGLSAYSADSVPQAEQEPEPVVEEVEEVEEVDGLAEVEPLTGTDGGWEDPLFAPTPQGRSVPEPIPTERDSRQPVVDNSTPSRTVTQPVTPSYTPPPPPPPRDSRAVVEPPVDPAPEPAAAASAPPANCEDLRQLEGAALLGALSDGHRACLEDRITSEASQTQKNKISRVLLVNAEASGNGDWSRLMRRHLEDIDRSDPDMCLKYALHLSKSRGTSSAHGVIRWADNALERKSRWSGPTYTRRVYDLHKLRAHAANRLWQRANEDLLNAGASREELAGKEEASRARAKSLAREWLDFARATSQNTSEAMALCVSTAGSKKFCKE